MAKVSGCGVLGSFCELRPVMHLMARVCRRCSGSGARGAGSRRCFYFVRWR